MRHDTITYTVWPEPEPLRYPYSDTLGDHENSQFTYVNPGGAVDVDVYVSIGKVESAPWNDLPLSERQRWLHFDEYPGDRELGNAMLYCFIASACKYVNRFPAEPLVSIVIPTYYFPERDALLTRALNSLQRQTYRNIEVVVLSPTGEPEPNIQSIWMASYPILWLRSQGHAGNVGRAKRTAFGAAAGELLVELDHDDELTPRAIEHLVNAYNLHGEGFYYSDCTEVDENGGALEYPPGWGLGYGSYRDEGLDGKSYRVTNYPPVNKETVKHIVGVPNHFRAWSAQSYAVAGGHSPEMFVVDDYELLLRTFLTSKVVHIKEFGYIQHMRGSNTQDIRRKEIQRLVRAVWQQYAMHFEQREIEYVEWSESGEAVDPF